MHLATMQAHLVKELLPGGAWLDGELQLSVHGSDADIHLREEENRFGFTLQRRWYVVLI